MIVTALGGIHHVVKLWGWECQAELLKVSKNYDCGIKNFQVECCNKGIFYINATSPLTIKAVSGKSWYCQEILFKVTISYKMPKYQKTIQISTKNATNQASQGMSSKVSFALHFPSTQQQK